MAVDVPSLRPSFVLRKIARMAENLVRRSLKK
jgi:hypothetical protein